MIGTRSNPCAAAPVTNPANSVFVPRVISMRVWPEVDAGGLEGGDIRLHRGEDVGLVRDLGRGDAGGHRLRRSAGG